MHNSVGARFLIGILLVYNDYGRYRWLCIYHFVKSVYIINAQLITSKPRTSPSHPSPGAAASEVPMQQNARASSHNNPPPHQPPALIPSPHPRASRPRQPTRSLPPRLDPRLRPTPPVPPLAPLFVKELTRRSFLLRYLLSFRHSRWINIREK